MNSSLTYTIDNIAAVAVNLIANSPSKIILFYGEMGSGKTTLIKSIASKLGYTKNISSPTFGLVNEYQIAEGLIFHFDLYRLEQEEEAYDIGFEEYLYSKHWVFIEWPEKIPNLLPDNCTKINIEILNYNERKITYLH